MKKEKQVRQIGMIIQIAVLNGAGDYVPHIFALTENGEIYRRRVWEDDGDVFWEKIPLPSP